MQGRRPGAAGGAQGAAKARPAPAGGNALVTFDAQLAKQQEKAELEKHRGPSHVAEYTGPKVRWEDTGLYKALVKSKDIEEELTKIRNLIRKRTDPGYEPDEDDFAVAPARKFDAKADYYKLLDLDDFATARDIKGAYRKLALFYHPDKNRDKKPDQLRAMQDEFEKIQEAYEVLSDRPTRRQYDRAKFDEARAKSQGMNSSLYSQKTKSESGFWGRWSAAKEAAEGGGGGGVGREKVKLSSGSTARTPKAPDFVVEVKISLEKALRGGLKIREVKRDRMQRAFGSASKTAKPVHVKIEPGQADGSEFRLEGDGNWPSLAYTPGDLVFQFRHKPHGHLRQAGSPGDGHLQLASPLVARARASDAVLSVWTPTFRGQMILLRFANPLLPCAPSKSCSITLRLAGEGLPVACDASKRGALAVVVEVRLEGEAFVPSLCHSDGGAGVSDDPPCKETLVRRRVRGFNRQAQLRAELASTTPAGALLRRYAGGAARWVGGGRCSGSVELPVVATVWEAAPGTDPVAFARAAASLGAGAARDPERFAWGQQHPCLMRRRLAPPGHATLHDREIESDEEEALDSSAVVSDAAKDANIGGAAEDANGGGGGGGVALGAARGGGGMFDFDDLEEEDAAGAMPSAEAAPLSSSSALVRRQRPRPEVEDFLLAFDLGPPEGLPEPGWADDGAEGQGPSAPSSSGAAPGAAAQRQAPAAAAVAAVAAPAVPAVAALVTGVALSEAEQETKEERDLTFRIRRKQGEIDQAKRKWSNRRQRLKGEREEEEGLLRELLEKDKKREYERIEREMNGLRDTFEYQVSAEKRWMDEFKRDAKHRHEWICVFKPAMVARKKPSEDGPIARRIMLDEVVKTKGEPTSDLWVQLEGSGDWALTWHQKHGRLLQQWFGHDQQKFLDLQTKIEDRRKVRNQTFVDYRRKKKEVEEWTIPPGPTQEELCEIEDEEGEQLAAALEPLLKELRDAKRRLRELRQKRLEASAERARREAAGGSALGGGELPAGFKLDERPAEASAPSPSSSSSARAPAAAPEAPAVPPSAFDGAKAAADRAFREREWNTALRLYGEALAALDLGDGDGIASASVGSESAGAGAAAEARLLAAATVLSNRSLVRSKLDDWAGSLADAAEATKRRADWPRAWIRKATAELRLLRSTEALSSLRRGLACAGKVAGQFLPLVTECEAALYNDSSPGGDLAPSSATERLRLFRAEGGQCFERGNFGEAVLCYTRALYHRSMMEGTEEAVVLSNRAGAFLRLELPAEALADALASSERDPRWAKPLVRAAQASQLLGDFRAAYQHFAKARRLDEHYKMAQDGLNECLQKMIRWEYPAASKRWGRFSLDRHRPREKTRIWALSDVFFDQHGTPEWCKSLSSSFFRDDVLMLAGNLADSLPSLRFALTVLKSKFRRIFFVPGNHDLWVRRVTLQTILKGEKVKDEQRAMVDSVSKLLEVLQVCDELGVETAPAEVAAGVFVVPMSSWYSRDFVDRERRREKASERDADAKVTIDQWIQWPFPCGSDDAWKFFMRMNEPALRATLAGKVAFERFTDQKAVVLTMTHFLTRPELDIDWTVPGIWDYVGCEGLDEQIRAVGSSLHVYGRACIGPVARELDGLTYVHNYIGTTEKHRPGMAPFCVFDGGEVAPKRQPAQEHGFNFRPLERPKEEESLLRPRRFGGG